MVAASFQQQPESESHVSLFSPQELRQQVLPPSERDFQVFEEVVFGGASTRAAAALFGVSQTRIVQVRQRVAEWMGAEVPPTPRLTPLQRLRLAAHIAEGRADFLYSQAMEGWRASQQPQTSVCRGSLGSETRTRERHGDPRYLLAAMRISERQMQLSGTIRKVLAEAEDRESDAGVRQSGIGGRDEQEAMNPPVRACSLDGASLEQGHKEDATVVDVSDCQEDVCDDFEDRRRAFLAAFQEDSPTVQSPLTDGNGMLLEEPEAAPRNGHFSGTALLGKPVAPSRPLNRKERRARQRLLERKMRKAK